MPNMPRRWITPKDFRIQLLPPSATASFRLTSHRALPLLSRRSIHTVPATHPCLPARLIPKRAPSDDGWDHAFLAGMSLLAECHPNRRITVSLNPDLPHVAPVQITH